MGTIKQLSLFDSETGELQKSITFKSLSKLKEGWYVMYKDAMDLLLHSEAPPSTLKVFVKLCNMQSYDSHIFVSRKYLEEDLRLSRKTVWSAITWLKDNNFIIEEKKNGQSTFVINPSVSNCGTASIDTKVQKFKDAGKVGWAIAFEDLKKQFQ